MLAILDRQIGAVYHNLPEPGIIAAEIAEDLEAALEQIRGILENLRDTE